MPAFCVRVEAPRTREIPTTSSARHTPKEVLALNQPAAFLPFALDAAERRYIVRNRGQEHKPPSVPAESQRWASVIDDNVVLAEQIHDPGVNTVGHKLGMDSRGGSATPQGGVFHLGRIGNALSRASGPSTRRTVLLTTGMPLGAF